MISNKHEDFSIFLNYLENYLHSFENDQIK